MASAAEVGVVEEVVLRVLSRERSVVQSCGRRWRWCWRRLRMPEAGASALFLEGGSGISSAPLPALPKDHMACKNTPPTSLLDYGVKTHP